MKKYIIAICMVLLSLNVQAQSRYFCSYVDYFHLKSENPLIMIGTATANKEVLLQIISPKSFEMRDAGSCTAGYGHVTFVSNKLHWCMLDIKDGPFMRHPSVTASCHGLNYKGLDYNGDHSYTINIE